MAFAFGPHMCLGIHLARMETAVVLNAVLDRLPDLRLDPAADDVHITGLAFRSPPPCPSSSTPDRDVRFSLRVATKTSGGSGEDVLAAEVPPGDAENTST